MKINYHFNYSKTGSNFPSDADMKGKYKEAAEI